MIVVTGGAGFIGSSLIWALNQRGKSNILIVDNLGTSDKWRNLVPLRYVDYMDKDLFLEGLRADVLPDNISAVIHLGACTNTLEPDGSYLVENNFKFSQALAGYCLNKHIRFIYASSTATYGDGRSGFDDDPEDLEKLRPMNMFGYSKHMFDLWAHRNNILKRMVGLKFSNVFGPNEQHKGDMRSMALQCFEQISSTGKVKLFNSDHADFANGEQMRDFLYIKDAVEILLFLLDNPELNGLYNAGSGKPRSWNDLAKACFRAMNKEPEIEFIDMPKEMFGRYQNYTCLNIERLRKEGFRHRYRSLEKAVNDYYENYYSQDSYLGDSPQEASQPPSRQKRRTIQ